MIRERLNVSEDHNKVGHREKDEYVYDIYCMETSAPGWIQNILSVQPYKEEYELVRVWKTDWLSVERSRINMLRVLWRMAREGLFMLSATSVLIQVTVDSVKFWYDRECWTWCSCTKNSAGFKMTNVDVSNSRPTFPEADCHVIVNILATWIFLQCALCDCWVSVLAADQLLLALYDVPKIMMSWKTAYCKVGVLILNFLFWHTGRWWSSSSWNIWRWRRWKWWR